MRINFSKLKKSMKTELLFGAVLLGFFISCQENDVVSEIGSSSISKVIEEVPQSIPFENEVVLKGFSSDPTILDYNLARKLTLLELIGSGMNEEMNWEGYKLSDTPVVLYGFDNKPKFYDFIVLDAEGKMKGTVTAYARKNASTMIKAVSQEIKDYGRTLSKAGSTSASIFVDWMGESYVGLRGKAGDIPSEVINAETGEAADSMKELNGEEIIETMKDHVLPELLTKDFSSFEGIENKEENADLLEEVEAAKSLTLETLTDSLSLSLKSNTKNTEAFWNEMDEEIDKVNKMDDSEIINDSGKSIFSRLFRRIFSKVDRSTSYLSKYVNSGTYKGPSSGAVWCGPWVCGYICYVNTGQNKYNYFVNCASSFGELGVLNFALRIFGRPLTPSEMSWSMPIASGGKIHISPFLWFSDFSAYDQIHHHHKPALRLCAKNGDLHWTLAYGSFQSGNYFWRNYYFLQQDNASKGVYKNPNNKSNYSRVDWWNPWLMVWD